MVHTGVIFARSAEEVFDIYSQLATRQNGCLECQNIAPTCPSSCGPNQICQFVVSQDCKVCASSQCVAAPTATASKSSSSGGPGVGAIAGGVVGGVAAIAIVTYLVWRFCIKTKRQQVPQQEIYDEVVVQEQQKADNEKSLSTRRDHRSSTHTVHSIASTVLTRASNIIQIAYIPGVTNRATPTSPTLLVPPVPPIPMAVSNTNSPTPYEEQHFFVPGDLRDSRYSALSGYSDRTSYARTSYAPRSSIASTIYGKNAVIVAPAQTGMRAKPAVVSVKSTGAGSSSSGASTPPVPSVDYEKYSRPKSRDSTFSIGSTFVKNVSAATATQARAQQVKVVRVGSNGSKKTVDVSDSETPPIPVRESATSNAITIIEESPAVDQGPFSDPPERPTHRSTSSLSAVAEEATRRAADRSSKRISAERETSPFGDEHATKDD